MTEGHADPPRDRLVHACLCVYVELGAKRDVCCTKGRVERAQIGFGSLLGSSFRRFLCLAECLPR